MKRCLLLICFVTFISQAQIVNIPDANFKAALIDRDIDLNSDGEIQVSEAASVESLYISASSISDLTGISSFVNLTSLDCGWNELTTLDVSNLVNLETLQCHGNQLTTLDLSGLVNLDQINCRNNMLTTIDISNLTNIYEFYCQNNQLTTLDLSNQLNLDKVNCSNNALTSLNVSGSINLWELDCSFNNLTTLNVSGLDTLWSLICRNNQLTSLNVSGLNDLGYLECNNNQLTSLNFTNCPNLYETFAGYNNITSLDFTGVGSFLSSYFSFSNNSISSMVFPAEFRLGSLLVDFNQIVDLDLSNVISLNSALIFGNPIETINIKNGVNDFDIINLNTLNSLELICADEIELDDIYDDFDFMSSGAIASTYCTFEPGGAYNRLTGIIRLDLDNDGCDASDSLISNILIEINDGTDQGFAAVDQTGNYNAFVALGDYSLTPNFENPDWFNATPNTSNVLFTDLNNLSVQDYCVTPNGVHQDVEIIITPFVPAQPGFDAFYNVVYRNKGNQVMSGDIELNYNDSTLDFVLATDPISNQTAGNLIWNYTNLYPLESRSMIVIFNVNSPMETPPVNIGDLLDFQVIINPTSSDETPSDNEFNYTDEVVGSYDPNDITCLEGDIVSPDMIGEYLHYNIRFENTGTAAATFVVVANEIDEMQYDLSSLQILNASHDMTTRIVDHKIEFIFDNINLAPEGRGNVVYKIKSLNSLTIGDSVSNNANIFFDYNFPIETNTATTVFETLSAEEFSQENSISVYPNPTKGQLFINSIYDIKDVVLYDIQGRKVQNYFISESKMLDVSSLSKGVYFLELTSIKGTDTIKIIKD